MGPGRPAKPTSVKVLEGTYRADRAVTDEVPPELLAEIPDPPEGLGEWGQREWHVVTRWLHSVGNLAATDLSLVAAYCNEVDNYWSYDASVKKMGAVVPFKKGGELVKLQRNPYTVLRTDALTNALRLAGQFGFTPSARARLTIGGSDPAKPKSKLAKLMDRKK
ncbi:phiRv1 phage protein [Fibrisoma limi BUZ 3]|uniref:PhiRv1 phage protein n=1 Tax=Fibrisoma limi BUZ 3 TaxID=1185876 RepID=I2GKP7_9BACT|nr:phage terminase small subunit P27 family [Fibrisoma limi]CCH54473.1 phiRv1 phage protein [Fibrisoma limi BUZ 3]